MDRQMLPPEFADVGNMVPPAPEYNDGTGAPPPQYPSGSPEQPQTNVMGMSGVSGPTAPVQDHSLAPAGQELDNELAEMIANAVRVEKKKKVKVPKPSDDLVRAIARTQEHRYSDRNLRITRDIELYRQRVSFVPSEFDKRHDTPVVSATIPNLVNKLTNMLSAPEPRIIVPFHDEETKVGSQSIENFGYWCRKASKRYYARSGGGNLQWDEFFYLHLHGHLVARILPDPDDEGYPFNFALVDPSTCYPVWKGDKGGLHTMVRKYSSTALDIILTYGANDPKLESKLKKEMGYGPESDLRELYDAEGDTIEYWDKQWRCVIWRDITVMPVTEHGYDCGVPFVVAIPKGEPKSMATPINDRASHVDEYGNTGYGPSRSEDLSQKGVSVFHHLVQTNRVVEILSTISLMEVEKALNPPTITYVAPQYLGDDPTPLNLRKRGNNRRVLNFMKVEAVPTSPRPTDSAPLMNKALSDIQEGSLPSVAHGNESGSNVSGFAVESLIAVAKDATLPYTSAFEEYLAQVIEMKLCHYKQFVLPFRTISVPSKRTYGHSPLSELTQEVLENVGIDVEVKLWAMSQQMLPGQINAATMAVQAGLWSIRKGMEHTGSLDPDRDFQDIISERAIQHPEIMENFLIPQAFMQRGQQNLAELWMTSVVMPKMQAMMMGGGPGGPAGPTSPAPPGAPPGANGQSNPTLPDTQRSTGGGPGTGKTPGSEG